MKKYSNPIVLIVAGLLAYNTPLFGASTIQLTDKDEKVLTEKIQSGTYGTVTSAMVLSGGEILFEHYGEGYDAESLHNPRSVTKTMTGMAVGAAIADGALEMDTPLAGFFADIAPFENPDQRKLEITVADLLTMSGPMECDDWNSFSRGNEERMYIVEDWTRFFWNLPIRGFPSWSPKTRSAPFDRAFSYCSAGVQMLGEVVERAVNMPFVDYFRERFFEPLDITSYRWGFNGEERPHLMGGLELTTRGLAAFAELQRQEGSWEGQQLFPAAWARESVTAHTRVPGDDWEYGYLWWLREYETGDQKHASSSMMGNGGNRVMVVPGLGLSLVVTKTDFMQSGMHDKTEELIAEILRLVENSSSKN